MTKRRSMMDAILAGDIPKGMQVSSFQSFVSPIDGSQIGSTQQLREHEKRHGVRQVGNDLLGKGNHGTTIRKDGK